MVGYGRCPRCGRWAMEHLRTHSHCWECNFFPEEESGYRIWNLLEFRLSRFVAQRSAGHKQVNLDSLGAAGLEIPYQQERDLTAPVRGVL